METQTKIMPSRLLDFYNGLANGAAQRELMRNIREKTGAAHTTVIKWIRAGVIPISPRDREIIAELCGKDVSEFWGDVQTPKRGGKNRGK